MAIDINKYTGNLTADPELRFTPNGTATASFTVASSQDKLNRETKQWERGDELFLRVVVWEGLAENVAESLRKGDRVIVTGRLTMRTYTDREGKEQRITELKASDVAASLRFATADVKRVSRNRQNDQNQQAQGGGWGQQQAPQQQQAQQPQGGWDSNAGSEGSQWGSAQPPF